MTTTRQAEMVIASEPSALAHVRDFVGSFGRDALEPPLPDIAIGELQLAVNEAVANVIRHAHRDDSEQPIRIAAASQPDAIEIRLYYGGEEFDPRTAPPPAFDGSREGGFGIYMIYRSVDEVEYQRPPEGGNCICLVKRRALSTPP